MMMKKYVAGHLKDMNRKLVYRIMETNGEMTRTEISTATHISPPTVMKITDYFLSRSIFLEGEEVSSGLGRKAKSLIFNDKAAFTIGVNFEDDRVGIGCIDLRGGTAYYKQIKNNLSLKDFIKERIAPLLSEFIAANGIEKEKLLGIGIGIPAVVDTKKNIVEFAPLLGVDVEYNLTDDLGRVSNVLGVPVYIENDVNGAAMGEYSIRSMDRNSDLIYVSVSSGVGAGIILDGKLRIGKNYTAGEVGYMVFESEFKTRKDSEGWLEKKVNVISPLDPASHVASFVAMCIANMTATLDIDRVVVGGQLADSLGEGFFGMLEKYMAKLCLNNINLEKCICSDSVIAGMAIIAREKMLYELLAD